MRVELKRIKLTDRFVKSATTGGPRSPIFMDDGVIGFYVQIRDTGRKDIQTGLRLDAQVVCERASGRAKSTAG